jgi:hypothetical protein
MSPLLKARIAGGIFAEILVRGWSCMETPQLRRTTS